MNDVEFCNEIIKNYGECLATYKGGGPWNRTCSKEACPIYQEMPCFQEESVIMAKDFLNKEANT